MNWSLLKHIFTTFFSKKQIVQNPWEHNPAKFHNQSKGTSVTQEPKLTEELKRRAPNIPKHRSVCKSAMESGRSLMWGEPVSSRQCGRICISTRKATDRERFHHSDKTNTSSRTCPHKHPVLTLNKLLQLCWIHYKKYGIDLLRYIVTIQWMTGSHFFPSLSLSNLIRLKQFFVLFLLSVQLALMIHPSDGEKIIWRQSTQKISIQNTPSSTRKHCQKKRKLSHQGKHFSFRKYQHDLIILNSRVLLMSSKYRKND